MVSTIDVATAETQWVFLEDVRGVALVTRQNGKPQAVIEFCPREGFRLTDCQSGEVNMFASLDAAKDEYGRRVARGRDHNSQKGES